MEFLESELDRADDGRLELRLEWSAGRSEARPSFAIRSDEIGAEVWLAAPGAYAAEFDRRLRGLGRVARWRHEANLGWQLQRLLWKVREPIDDRTAPLRLRSEDRHDGQVVFQFAPLPEAVPLLDGVMLTVAEIGGEIVGTLQVNPQEHSPADYVRSLVHRD